VSMFVVRGTKTFRDRASGVAVVDGIDGSTSILGEWYVNVVRWRRPVALFVSELTLLPVLLPLAPANKVIERLPGALAEVLGAIGLDPAFIDGELAEMTDWRLGSTRNRSVLGVMNEFAFLARFRYEEDRDAVDLLSLSVDLAGTPCSPLYKRAITPRDEVHAVAAEVRERHSASGAGG
jgi:hypothetical protein